MLKLGRLTDYAIVLLTHFVRRSDLDHLTARELSEASQLPLPTVSKLCKVLSRGEVLQSLRGVKGGYHLTSPPSKTTLISIIEAVEGPIALTDCCGEQSVPCQISAGCPTAPNWQLINTAVRTALASVSLADMVGPLDEEREAQKLVTLHVPGARQ